MTVEEKAQAARALFGDLVSQIDAEQEVLAEAVGFDKAGLLALIRQLGFSGSGQGEPSGTGEDLPSEKIARLRDVLGDTAAFVTAEQRAAQVAYLFESGIFDPLFASRQVATADGQVAVARIDTRKR